MAESSSSGFSLRAVSMTSCSVMNLTSGPIFVRSSISSQLEVKKPGTRPPITPMRIRPSVLTVFVTRIAFSSPCFAGSEPTSA